MAAEEANLGLLKQIFSDFELTSGLITNIEKTAIIPFNAPQTFINAIPTYGYKPEYSFTTLGIAYSTDHREFIIQMRKIWKLKLKK